MTNQQDCETCVYRNYLPDAPEEVLTMRDNCYGCNSYEPVKSYCMRYLRGAETAAYMCPIRKAKTERGETDGK